VLPDRSILIGQKLAKNAKIKNFNETFWVIFKQCDPVFTRNFRIFVLFVFSTDSFATMDMEMGVILKFHSSMYHSKFQET